MARRTSLGFSLNFRFSASGPLIFGLAGAIMLVSSVTRADLPVATSTAPAAATQPANAPTFAKYCPAWTDAYLEIKQLDNIIHTWLGTSPSPAQRTDTASATSQPATTTTSAFLVAWSAAVKTTFGLTGRDFLDNLLADHVGLAWGGPDQPRQFGLICRPAHRGAIPMFLAAAKAQPVETDPTKASAIKLYQIVPKYVHVAVFDDTLILATVGPTGDTGMFYDMVDLAAGGTTRSLLDRDDFAQLCRQIDPQYQVFFSFLTGQTVDPNRSVEKDPLIRMIFQQVSFIAFTARLADQRIDMKAVLQPNPGFADFRPNQPLQLDTSIRQLISADSIAVAYAKTIAPAQGYQRLQKLADQADQSAREYLMIFNSLLPNPQIRQEFLESLGPELIVLVRRPIGRSGGHTPPSAADADDWRIPAAVMVKLKNPSLGEHALTQVLSLITDVGPLNLLGGQGAELFVPDEMMHKGYIVHRIPVKGLPIRWVWPEPLSIHSSSDIAWVIVGDYLILASDPQWLIEIIDLLSAPSTTSRPADRIFSQVSLGHSLMTFDLPATAACLKLILDRGSTTSAPASAPAARSPVVLGVTVRSVPDQATGQTQIQVVDVLPGWPADGRLYPRDIIIAVDQVPLDTDNPRAQFRRLVLERAERGAIKFTVRRKETSQEVSIELGSSAQTQPKTLNPEPKDPQRPTIKLRAKPEVAEVIIRTLRLLRQAVEPAAERYRRLTVTAVTSPSGQINIEATIK